MSGYPAQIKEAQTKLASLESKIEEIEGLKLMEPKLRQQAAGLVAKIAEMKETAEANQSENTFFEKEVNEEAAPAPAAPAKTPPAAPRTAEDERKAQLRAINKKLKQIDILKHKDNLDEDMRSKIATEPMLREQVAALERGETYVEAAAEKTPAAAKVAKKVEEPNDDDSTASRVCLPTDPAEVEKRMKNLKKKLQQIAKLKENGGVLDAEATQKIASEHRIHQEIAALEEGKDEVVFVDKADADLKMDLEKKLKNVNKKLESIQKLKTDANLDADGKAKVASESSLKKEAGELQRQIAEFNKKERERVAERLGWEVEQKKKKAQKK